MRRLKKKLFINQILADEVHEVLTSTYHPSLNATELLQSQLNGGWLTKTELSRSHMSNSHASSDYHKLDLKEG